jgi:ABC-type sugar transport system, periplasmic component
MAGDGKAVTDPFFDLEDFLGLADATGLKSRGFDGKLWQLPDQSFINVYWFRKDWFDRPDLQAAFKKKYGYDLGVPVNWSAYEDIAAFFKDEVKEIDGKAVFGHMDYGKKAPDLGWRFTDDWLGNGRCRRRRDTQRLSRRRMGYPHGWVAGRSAPASPAAVTSTAQPPNSLYASTWIGCANTPLRVRSAWISISPCPVSRRAMSLSRSSGTRPSPPPCSIRGARVTTPWTMPANRSGAWHRRPMGLIGRKV